MCSTYSLWRPCRPTAFNEFTRITKLTSPCFRKWLLSRLSNSPGTECEQRSRENRQMALGRPLFQDAQRCSAGVRARQDSIQRTTGEAFAGGPCRRSAAGEDRRRRFPGASRALERNARACGRRSDVVSRDGREPEVAGGTCCCTEGYAAFRRRTRGQTVQTRSPKIGPVSRQGVRKLHPATMPRKPRLS